MNKPLWAGAGVALLGVAGVTGVLVASSGGEEEVTVQATATGSGTGSPSGDPSPTGIPSATPTSTTSVPDDWSTYSDPTLGFSLRYPPDLAFKDLTGPTPVRGQRAIEFRSTDETARGFTIGILGNAKGLTLEDWVGEFVPCEPNTIREDTVAGKTALVCPSRPLDVVELAVTLEHASNIVYMTFVLPESEVDLVLGSLDFSTQ